MIVFYDPTNKNQVMAVYSGDTSSPVWEQRGYLRVDVPPEFTHLIGDRDVKLTISDGEVTAVIPATNRLQPIPQVNKDKEDYAAAITDRERQNVIARKLGLV